ncbi:hypothetical protein M0R45_018938 [Rubus argutus]|uniref:DUF4216 domain-containing protein n=1 Tax=Rubus argutus TaxID=59490 RepID=A0AAW1X5T3_RUBAR
MPETIRKHMIVYGMDKVCQDGLWREQHGEPLRQHNNPTGFPNVLPVETNVPDCGMLDMINDAFHEEHTSVNSDVEPDHPSEPTPEAANFFNLLKEADMDIYPGCTRMKKLDFLVHAFKIKCLYKVKGLNLDRNNNYTFVCISARDLNPIDGEVDYYSVVTDIIELSYDAGHKVVLFRGDWVDSLVMENGIKTDAYGFTLVNFSRLLQQYDPFILASQEMQVFYIQDLGNIDWHLVVKT